jgi:hypothetical protein
MLFVIFGIIFIILAAGWVSNLIKLIKLLKSEEGKSSLVTPLFIGRVVGVFVLPLGGIIGFIRN